MIYCRSWYNFKGCVPDSIFISKLEAECLYELISNCVTLSYIDKLLLLGTPRSCSVPDCEIEAGCNGDCWYSYIDENWWQQFLTAHSKIKGFLQPYCWQEIKDAGRPFCFGKESWEQHVLCCTAKKAVNAFFSSGLF